MKAELYDLLLQSLKTEFVFDFKNPTGSIVFTNKIVYAKAEGGASVIYVPYEGQSFYVCIYPDTTDYVTVMYMSGDDFEEKEGSTESFGTFKMISTEEEFFMKSTINDMNHSFELISTLRELQKELDQYL